MQLPLPIRPKLIPPTAWDLFLEEYYIPYLQRNYQKILKIGIQNEDIEYFESALNKLYNQSQISGLGFWGALISSVVSAIPSAVSAISQYKLGKQQIKLQKEEIEARKQREAAEAALVAKQQEAVILAAKQAPTSDRAIEIIKDYSPYLLIGGIGLIGLIILIKRR